MVSSNDFPRFTRKLDTGGPDDNESDGIVANIQVHHSAAHASLVRLPVVRDR